ncbi:6173_t:CDS:2, partial [Funneliformis mosseae]
RYKALDNLTLEYWPTVLSSRDDASGSGIASPFGVICHQNAQATIDYFLHVIANAALLPECLQALKYPGKKNNVDPSLRKFLDFWFHAVRNRRESVEMTEILMYHFCLVDSAWNRNTLQFLDEMLVGKRVECFVHSWFCDYLANLCIKQRNCIIEEKTQLQWPPTTTTNRMRSPSLMFQSIFESTGDDLPTSILKLGDYEDFNSRLLTIEDEDYNEVKERARII